MGTTNENTSYVNLGNHGHPLATDDPNRDDYLPVDDALWDQGVSFYGGLILSSVISYSCLYPYTFLVVLTPDIGNASQQSSLCFDLDR